MKKKFNLKVMAEIAIFAAVGYALDFFQGAITGRMFPNGGSIGIAMVVIFIISYRRGTLAGVLTGLIMGLLDLFDGFYAISDTFLKVFLQIFLDYIVAYPLVGLAGLFRNKVVQSKSKKSSLSWMILGCFVGSFAKFLSHFMSGVFFWPSNKWGGPAMYSFLYNGMYMLPCFVVSTVVFCLIWWKQPSIVVENYEKDNSMEVEEHE